MLRILTKHLENERAWLRTESLGTMDRKYQEGARMAKERIPQLEAAIKLLSEPDISSKTKDISSKTQDQQPKPKKSNLCQLKLFHQNQ